MKLLKLKNLEPFPPVGSRIKLDCGKGNHNTWLCFGEVLAVVEGKGMLVERWLPSKRYHKVFAIDAEEWTIRREHFVVREKK